MCWSRVFRDHQPCTCCREKPQSYHSRELNANGWTAYHAPHPANVNWLVWMLLSKCTLSTNSSYRNNLGSSGCSWYFRAILLNLFVVGIVGAVAFLIILLNVASLPALGKLHDVCKLVRDFLLPHGVGRCCLLIRIHVWSSKCALWTVRERASEQVASVLYLRA